MVQIIKYSIFLLCCLHVSIVYSQKLDKTELSATKEDLSITIRITDCKSTQKFFPTADFYYKDGSRIGTSTISLKSGSQSLACGATDVLLWRPANDKVTINNSLYANVSVRTELKIRLSPHLAKSLAFPGWGDYRLRNGKIYFAYGLAGYGLIASALVLQNNAIKTYDSYKLSKDIGESEDLFAKAVKQRNISYAALASAAVVWTIDLAMLTNKYKTVKANPSKSNYYTALANKTFQAKSNMVHFDNRNDYDIAMDNGHEFEKKADDRLTQDEAYSLSNYQQAKTEYQKALKISANSQKAKLALETVQQKIENIEQRQKQYNQLITTAEKQMRSANYNEAEKNYNQALALYPNSEYVKSKLKEIEDTKTQMALQKNYKSIIEKADRCFREKKYNEAENLYRQALALKPNESYPKTQIGNCIKLRDQQICNSYIAKAQTAYNAKKYKEAKSYYEEAYAINPSIEIKSKIDLCQQRIDDIEWNELMHKANIAYAKDDYETALRLYEQADRVKPNQPKTIEQIIACKKELKKNEEVDLVTLYEQCKKAVFFIISADKQGIGQGSGFFITSDGVAVTNYHVYSGGYWSMAKIYTEDGESYNIDRVIASDKDKDYIIFKVANNGHKFPTVKLSKTQARVGEKAFAIGNPEGLSQTLSEGIISSYRNYDKSNTDFYIQTTVGITHGSSGGALFNMKGEVIGITSMGFDDVASANLNFAINILKISALNKYR